ncbi:phosphatase PAP2 family protein [Nocardia sp. NPDC003482]|uniref:Undecaprenyl-diphosphatase BcrC n=1 Tax=Nocardia cerradoensis TaxID=85688 RepID=A0A231GVF0_9NOCA|nr:MULTISPECIES: phosphatase PAP2 family protein [Nocardia]OXR40603.1 Undecaprenyl-diphosphatase BcrC [Nocardia cerradoensis]
MSPTSLPATVSAFDGARIDGSLLVEVTEFAQHTRWLNTPILWFTDAGLIVFAVLMLAAWWRARRENTTAMAAALLAPVAVVAAFALAEIVKQIAAEPRPCHALPHAYILEACPPGTDYAFPSGHATVAAATVAALYLTNRRLAAIAAVFALFEAATRVYVGGHYPHDVAASAVLALPIAYLVRRALLQPAAAAVTRLRTGPLAPLVTSTVQSAARITLG